MRVQVPPPHARIFTRCPQGRTYGCSADKRSSLANGVLGQQRRHDSDGMRLEIRATRTPVEAERDGRAYLIWP